MVSVLSKHRPSDAALWAALNEAVNDLDRYQIPSRRFAYRGGHYPVVEDIVIERGREKGRI